MCSAEAQRWRAYKGVQGSGVEGVRKAAHAHLVNDVAGREVRLQLEQVDVVKAQREEERLCGHASCTAITRRACKLATSELGTCELATSELAPSDLQASD